MFFFFSKTCNNVNLKHVITTKEKKKKKEKNRTNAKNLVITCFRTLNNAFKSGSDPKNLVGGGSDDSIRQLSQIIFGD